MDEAHGGVRFACTIAGSDSGGGAGIQADLKTFSALGVWGLSAITAVTAQNPGSVLGVWPLPEDSVRMQIEAVASEYPVDFFKTGMLANAGIVRTVSECLPARAGLVLDPVMISTSGAGLLEDEAREALIDLLVPKALVVTPNLAEAAVLSGMEKVRSGDEISKAADIILDMGAGAVLIKGGHGSGSNSTDILVTRDSTELFSGARLPHEFHGTGCCLSAAITAYLARGSDLIGACSSGKKFVEAAIAAAVAGRSGVLSVDPSFGWTHSNNKQ